MKASLDPRSRCASDRLGRRGPTLCSDLSRCPTPSVLHRQLNRYLTVTAAAPPERRLRLYANTVRASMPDSCTACRTSAPAHAPCAFTNPVAYNCVGLRSLLPGVWRNTLRHAKPLGCRCLSPGWRDGCRCTQTAEARRHRRLRGAAAASPSVPLVFLLSARSAGLGALAFDTCPLRACTAARPPSCLLRRRCVRLGWALRWVLSLFVPGCRWLSACLGLDAARRPAASCPRASNSRLRRVWGSGGGFSGAGLLGIAASGRWVGLVAEGAWPGFRGGSVEATGVARRGGEVVGGAGLWGWGGVQAGVVGTAGAARGGKSARVRLSPSGDRLLFSVFPGLVVIPGCARVGLETAECISWRANLASLAPELRLALRFEATTSSGPTTFVPTSRYALISSAEVTSPLSLVFRRLRSIGL